MGRNDRYDLMCAIDVYDNQQPPKKPGYSISGGGRPSKST